MSTITKQMLAENLNANCGPMSRDQALRSVDAVFDAITAALLRGDRVELRGFGVFDTRTRKARPARNPKTGAAAVVPARVVARFKPGKALAARAVAAD